MKLWLSVGFEVVFACALPAAEPALFSLNNRILFQGDSITDGNRGRSADPNYGRPMGTRCAGVMATAG